MQVSFETKSKEKSQVSLVVTVGKEDVAKEYKNILLDIQKNVQFPGFRVGKVPFSIIEAKYKESVLSETASKIIDEAFKEIADKLEKKPLPYAVPKMEEFKLPDLLNDYVFELTYDIFPEYSFGVLKNIEAEKNEVKIENKDIEKEIESYQKEYATIEPKEGKIEKDDIVMVEYSVLENGNEVYKKENDYIYIGKNYDIYKLGDDLIGLKKGDEKEFEKTYPKDETENLAGKTFKIKLKVKEVKKEKLPELNDEFVKQVDETCKTVAEFKNKVKENLQKFADDSIKSKVINEALDKLVDTFQGDIPNSMVEYQLDMYYQDILNRVGGNEKKAENMLKLENLTKETYREKMRDRALSEIKKALIIEDIIKKENISATEEEVKKHIEPYSAKYKIAVDELLKRYKDSGRYESIKHEVDISKAYDFIYDNVKIKKGKKIVLEDLFNNNFK
jgi:trigger factor